MEIWSSIDLIAAILHGIQHILSAHIGPLEAAQRIRFRWASRDRCQAYKILKSVYNSIHWVSRRYYLNVILVKYLWNLSTRQCCRDGCYNKFFGLLFLSWKSQRQVMPRNYKGNQRARGGAESKIENRVETSALPLLNWKNQLCWKKNGRAGGMV